MHMYNAVEITANALMLVLLLSMPPILVASITGLIVSLLQALTQIQEQTISFAVRLVAVVATILLTAGWLGDEMFDFADNIFMKFPYMLK